MSTHEHLIKNKIQGLNHKRHLPNSVLPPTTLTTHRGNPQGTPHPAALCEYPEDFSIHMLLYIFALVLNMLFHLSCFAKYVLYYINSFRIDFAHLKLYC